MGPKWASSIELEENTFKNQLIESVLFLNHSHAFSLSKPLYSFVYFKHP